MQAIVMAAGKGSRIQELTGGKPKAFLEIRGIPMIDYNIALLHHHNIRDILVVTGYCDEAFTDHLKDIPGIRFTFNPFYEQANVLGSFFIAQQLLAETDTVYMHADTLCDPGIFIDMLNSAGDMVLPVDFGPCDEEAMKIRRENGRLVEISKEIQCENSEGEFIGIAKITGGTIEPLRQAATRLMRGKSFLSYFEGAIQELIDTTAPDIRTVPTDGRFWGEVDFAEDFERMKAHFPENLYQIGCRGIK